jgi:hypothetical protein
MRQINATPHVAQNLERNGGSAIDGRTTRHAGYTLSLRARKLIEDAFGWGKDIGLLRRPKFRGRQKMEYADRPNPDGPPRDCHPLDRCEISCGCSHASETCFFSTAC